MPDTYPLDHYKKEILVPYLKKQMRDLSEIINQLEEDDHFEKTIIQNFFMEKKKNDRRILRTIF